MSRDEASLLDMARACDMIMSFAEGLTKDDFLADARTRSAVLHQLLVLGEAAKRLGPGFTSQHPHVPWRLVAGMRDRLIHAYDAVDLDEVWLAVHRDVPRLRRDIDPLLPRR